MLLLQRAIKRVGTHHQCSGSTVPTMAAKSSQHYAVLLCASYSIDGAVKQAVFQPPPRQKAIQVDLMPPLLCILRLSAAAQYNFLLAIEANQPATARSLVQASTPASGARSAATAAASTPSTSTSIGTGNACSAITSTSNSNASSTSVTSTTTTTATTTTTTRTSTYATLIAELARELQGVHAWTLQGQPGDASVVAKLGRVSRRGAELVVEVATRPEYHDVFRMLTACLQLLLWEASTARTTARLVPWVATAFEDAMNTPLVAPIASPLQVQSPAWQPCIVQAIHIGNAPTQASHGRLFTIGLNSAVALLDANVWHLGGRCMILYCAQGCNAALPPVYGPASEDADAWGGMAATHIQHVMQPALNKHLADWDAEHGHLAEHVLSIGRDRCS